MSRRACLRDYISIHVCMRMTLDDQISTDTRWQYVHDTYMYMIGTCIIIVYCIILRFTHVPLLDMNSLIVSSHLIQMESYTDTHTPTDMDTQVIDTSLYPANCCSTC